MIINVVHHEHKLKTVGRMKMEKRSTSVEKLKKQKIAFEKAMKNMTPYQTLLVKTFMAGVKAACGMSVSRKREKV